MCRSLASSRGGKPENARAATDAVARRTSDVRKLSGESAVCRCTPRVDGACLLLLEAGCADEPHRAPLRLLAIRTDGPGHRPARWHRVAIRVVIAFRDGPVGGETGCRHADRTADGDVVRVGDVADKVAALKLFD